MALLPETSGTQHLVKLLVPLPDPLLHATGQEGVSIGEGVDEGCSGEAGAPVAQVFEHQLLQGHPIGDAFKGEGLDYQGWRPDLVEASTETGLEPIAFDEITV